MCSRIMSAASSTLILVVSILTSGSMGISKGAVIPVKFGRFPDLGFGVQALHVSFFADG